MKVKFDLKKFASIVMVVAPVALSAAGVPPELTTAVMHLVVAAQSKPGKTGPEKKAYVMDMLQTGGAITNMVEGHPVINVPEIVAAVSAGIDGTIAMVDAVKNIPMKLAPAAAL